MVNATELRIGNWVIIDDTVFDEKARKPYYYQMSAFDLYKIEDAERENGVFPIVLTPEILDKAGFKEFCGDWEHPELEVRITDLDNGLELCSSNGDWFQPHVIIKTVHHLQNLIHSLTGTELNINL